MRCPICGREYAPDHPSCSHCGTDFKILEASLLYDPIPDKTATPGKKHYGCIKWAVVCIALLLGASIVIGPILSDRENASGPSTQTTAVPGTTHTTQAHSTQPTAPMQIYEIGSFQTAKHNIEIGTMNEETRILYDTTLINVDDLGKFQEFSQSSLDGGSRAILFENGQLGLIKDGRFQLISGKVLDFKLSANGNAVAYTVQMDDTQRFLYLYNAENHCNDCIIPYFGDQISDYAISPSGDTVAYVYAEQPGEPILYRYVYGANKYIRHFNGPILAVSDEGKRIFTMTAASGKFEYTLCVIENSKFTAISVYDGGDLYFTENQSQVLFFGGNTSKYWDGTLHHFCHGTAVPVLPMGCISQKINFSALGIVHTLPYKNFTGHVYRIVTQSPPVSLRFFPEDPAKSVLLTEEPSHYILDKSGKNLLYAKNNALYALQVNLVEPQQTQITDALYNNRFTISSPNPGALFGSQMMRISYISDAEDTLILSFWGLHDFESMFSRPLGEDINTELITQMVFDYEILYFTYQNTLFQVSPENFMWIKLADDVYQIERRPNGSIAVITKDGFLHILCVGELVSVTDTIYSFGDV